VIRILAISAILLALSACKVPLFEGGDHALESLAAATNNQDLDSLCIQSDELLDQGDEKLDAMSHAQAIEFSRISRENRIACNDREGTALELQDTVKLNNLSLSGILADLS